MGASRRARALRGALIRSVSASFEVLVIYGGKWCVTYGKNGLVREKSPIANGEELNQAFLASTWPHQTERGTCSPPLPSEPPDSDAGELDGSSTWSVSIAWFTPGPYGAASHAA